ncbi:unnamed protein product [Cunninghamella blakesleeana]
MVTLPTYNTILVSLPIPHVLLITINRPKQYNSLNPEANEEMEKVIDWAEAEDSICGDKAFCTGMDLVNAHKDCSGGNQNSLLSSKPNHSGFGGISNRNNARKPVIAAVNGYALGGGTEMILACDIVVATQKSKFGLPEVKQGVVIACGGLARVARSLPYQVAAEMVLTGRFIDAEEGHRYGLVNKVIPNDQNVVDAALEYAKTIIQNSPDAVMFTKQGLLLALERDSITAATKDWLDSEEAKAWRGGENLTIGLHAFANKQKPQYKNPVPIKRSKL